MTASLDLSKPEISRLSGARKTAILLTVLGEDSAAIVFRHLSGDDLRRVADEVANLGPVTLELSNQVVEEYCNMTEAQGHLVQGGHDLARRLLVKAFGEEDAQGMLQRLTSACELTSMESLQHAEPQKLSRFLEGEHPQTVALVLGQLGDRQASALLMTFPNQARAEAVKRLAALRRFSPEMAEKVSVVLSQRMKAVGEHGKRTYSGFQSVADIMNCIDTAAAQEILASIEHEEPSLAISIRDLMFTFEDLLAVGETQVRELTGAVDKRVLATALKGTSEDLKNHFFRTMSSRAVEMLKEDIESLGPIRNKEVLKAQGEVVAIARQLEAEGKIVLKGEANDEFVV
ncbi:MAG: flagellar motor switch protein FliG [Acidobacteriota bacterium]|nr:flagellar motor switch protein FliG [Acidobacteriota bacterium]